MTWIRGVFAFVICLIFINCYNNSDTDQGRKNKLPDFKTLTSSQLSRLADFVFKDLDLKSSIAEISKLKANPWVKEIILMRFIKANLLLKTKNYTDSIVILKNLLKKTKRLKSSKNFRKTLLGKLAIIHRFTEDSSNSELSNCAIGACPFLVVDLYRSVKGAKIALRFYKQILKIDPNDLKYRYLLNLTYMYLNQYPNGVPKEQLMAAKLFQSVTAIKPFENVAPKLGVNVYSHAGGSILEDFNNDGYVDILTSSAGDPFRLFYFKNTGDGHFKDVTEESGLQLELGGLNMSQTDINNDGFADVFITRGAWSKNKNEYSNITFVPKANRLDFWPTNFMFIQLFLLPGFKNNMLSE